MLFNWPVFSAFQIVMLQGGLYFFFISLVLLPYNTKLLLLTSYTLFGIEYPAFFPMPSLIFHLHSLFVIGSGACYSTELGLIKGYSDAGTRPHI